MEKEVENKLNEVVKKNIDIPNRIKEAEISLIPSFCEKGVLFTGYIPRPKWNDAMRKELTVYTGTLVNKWCNDETPLDECIEHAEKVLRSTIGEDGYELAKEFEEHGFSSDANLVSELDYVSYEKYNILERYIKEWVKNNSMKLTLPIGSFVKFKEVRKKEDITAEIVKLYPEKLQYGVWWQGHGTEKGKGHTILNAEDVILIP